MNIKPEVADILAASSIKEIGGEFHLLADQMEKDQYAHFKDVVLALRGEWRRSVNAHVFLYDPTDAIANAIEHGLPPSNPHAFFPTPEEIIEFMLDELNLPIEGEGEGLLFLEPSAGDGRIARLIRKRLPKATIHCYEIDPANQEILHSLGFEIKGEDFLKSKDDGTRYDYIVMNPPFKGKQYQKHIKHAWARLKPGAYLTSVVPDEFRGDKEFRNFVFINGWAEYIESPFETTKTECSVINIDNRPAEYLWEPCNGVFSSWYHHAVQVVLDADRVFSEQRKKVTSRNGVAALVERRVDHFIREYYDCLYFDDRVKEQVLEYEFRS